MFVVGYARTSTLQQEQGIEAQKEQIKSYCKIKNWELKQVFIDKGWSGAKLDRPGFKKMMEFIETNSVQVIVFTKLDRLARSLQSLLNLSEVLKKKGIDFVSIQDSIDTNTAQGRLAFQVMGAFAEFERNIIRERLVAGLERAKLRGVKLGPRFKNLPREQILDLYKKGVSVSFMAKDFRVSRSTMYSKLRFWGAKRKRFVEDEKKSELE